MCYKYLVALGGLALQFSFPSLFDGYSTLIYNKPMIKYWLYEKCIIYLKHAAAVS
jgi:hypothetical protein